MKYSIEDYEQQYGVLKVPLLLKLTIYYSLKHYLLAFVQLLTALPKLGRTLHDAMPFFEKFAYSHSTFLFVLSCIPALLVFISFIKRAPQTESAFWHSIWQKGRILLLATTILELVLIAGYMLLQLRTMTEFWLIIGYLDIVITVYLLRSQRVKDVFAEFPAYQKS